MSERAGRSRPASPAASGAAAPQAPLPGWFHKFLTVSPRRREQARLPRRAGPGRGALRRTRPFPRPPPRRHHVPGPRGGEQADGEHVQSEYGRAGGCPRPPRRGRRRPPLPAGRPGAGGGAAVGRGGAVWAGARAQGSRADRTFFVYFPLLFPFFVRDLARPSVSQTCK